MNFKKGQTIVMPFDKIGHKNNVYAKKGDRVTVIKIMADVLILDNKGERFACNINKIST